MKNLHAEFGEMTLDIDEDETARVMKYETQMAGLREHISSEESMINRLQNKEGLLPGISPLLNYPIVKNFRNWLREKNIL